MKFGKKLVVCIIVMISIILSVSRLIIIMQNFINSIDIRANQNINQNLSKRYYLERNIVDDIEDGQEITNDKIIEYIKSLYLYLGDNTDMIAIYSETKAVIFSNFEEINNIDLDMLFTKDTDSYALRKINDEHYMVFSSYWTINDKAIYIINIYDITDIYAERDRQMKEVIFTDIIILGIASIFIFIFSILLTKPIRELNATSKQIATGNFSKRINIKSNDEVGELSSSFNIMAYQIENKINSLSLSIKQKDDFINAFTHEIKTPLTAIMGYSDMLRLKKCDEELTKRALGYIYSESKRLEELSHKLMELMSLSDDRIEFQTIKVKDFINKISSKIILENIKLIINVEQAEVKADKYLLEVVIRNLIENSKKAEPRDNKILIQGKILENRKYEISVIDHGRGIPKKDINRVTEEFYMVDKSRSRRYGGSGIGLSLCKKIVESHGSELFIESKENVGTCISFELEVQKDEK